MIVKRNGEIASLAEIRAAIMRKLRIMRAFAVEARAAAVAAVLADAAWLRFRHGQTLGATANDGFDAAMDILVRENHG